MVMNWTGSEDILTNEVRNVILILYIRWTLNMYSLELVGGCSAALPVLMDSHWLTMLQVKALSI